MDAQLKADSLSLWKAGWKFQPALVWLMLLVVIRLTLGAADVTVFAAASLSEALTQVARAYPGAQEDKVVFNFASSSTLARQIQEGARADLFFSADEEKMNHLEEMGAVKKGTRRSLLSNVLVLVVPGDSQLGIRHPRDLSKAKRIALAEPNSVPAGLYARKFLEEEGVWAGLKSRIVPTENVRGALAAVESGNVDAGIVYKTDAAISKKVQIACELPLSSTVKISYPVALLSDGRAPAAAERFMAFLLSDGAAVIFRKFGFIVLSGTTAANGNG